MIMVWLNRESRLLQLTGSGITVQYPRALASKLDPHNIVLLACHPVFLFVSSITTQQFNKYTTDQ